MSTLEAVREILCQGAETPPCEVLKSAQEEMVRLSHLVENAKNVLQRKGARKKLSELEPLIPSMEIEVGLVQLEKSLEQVKSAAQRASARVHAQKLASLITALPASEEKEFFQQWLGDLNPSLASTQPGSAAAAEPPRVIPAAPAPPVPPPDPSLEIREALAPLEALAKTRPIAESAKIAHELEALARRCAAMGPGETRAKLEASINAITTELKLAEELKHLGQAIAALEQAVARTEADLSPLSAEHEQIVSRIARLNASPEVEALKQKLVGVEASLTARRDVKTIEKELEACAARIQKDPTDEAIDSSLAAFGTRIAQLRDVNARATLSQRLETLQKTKIQRRDEEKIASALAELRRNCRASGASFSAIRAALEEITKEVQQLPAGPGRHHLEKQLPECRDLVGALEENAPRKAQPPAVVLQLDPIKGRSGPSARPLVFVARDRFSIGRKPENEPPRADLLTPSTELRISRVHVTFFARQRQIHVLAGEEGKPSTNPALIDQTPLTATPLAVNFENERRIDLTGVFALQAKLMPSSTPFGPPFDQDAASHNSTVIVPAIGGALRVRPQGEDKMPVVAVWLFTDATIGSNSDCAISLPQSGMAPEQARIHFWKKTFWIEVLRAGSLVQLAGKSLTPGASQPLLSGQELRLGNFVYKVQLF